MRPVCPIVPCYWGCEKARALVDSIEATKFFDVRVEDDSVATGRLYTNSVICEALGRIEVEDEYKASPLEDDDFVSFVFQGDIRLWCVEPAIFLLTEVHFAVEVVEELVSQKVILCEIELSPSIPE